MNLFSPLALAPIVVEYLLCWISVGYLLFVISWSATICAIDNACQRLPLRLTLPAATVTAGMAAIGPCTLRMVIGAGLWAGVYIVAAWWGQLGGADVLVALTLGGCVGKYCGAPAVGVLMAIAIAALATAITLLFTRRRSGAHVPGMCLGCAVVVWAS